jgi:DNA-binding protein H-NS
MNIESIDLSQYSIEQLADLIQRADATIRSKKSETASVLRRQVDETAAALGISVSELLGLDKSSKRNASGAPKTTAKVAPKYRNTANSEQTWTGRGQKPVWLREAIEKGAKQEDFLIV